MVVNGTEANELNLFLQVRGKVEQSLEHFFITSTSSHFFNNIDLEQHLFKNEKEGTEPEKYKQY